MKLGVVVPESVFLVIDPVWVILAAAPKDHRHGRGLVAGAEVRDRTAHGHMLLPRRVKIERGVALDHEVSVAADAAIEIRTGVVAAVVRIAVVSDGNLGRIL